MLGVADIAKKIDANITQQMLFSQTTFRAYKVGTKKTCNVAQSMT